MNSQLQAPNPAIIPTDPQSYKPRALNPKSQPPGFWLLNLRTKNLILLNNPIELLTALTDPSLEHLNPGNPER